MHGAELTNCSFKRQQVQRAFDRINRKLQLAYRMFDRDGNMNRAGKVLEMMEQNSKSARDPSSDEPPLPPSSQTAG